MYLMSSRSLVLIVVLGLLLLSLPLVAGEDWGQERQDSTNAAGYSGDAGGSWTYDVGVEVDSRVVMSEGVVYFFDEDGSLHAFNPSERERDWVFEGSTGVTETPIVADGKAYIESEGDLLKINSSGEVEWRFSSGSVEFPPAVSDDVVYFGGDDGLWAVDSSTGEDIWHTSFGKMFGLTRVNNGIYGLTMEEGAIEGIEESLREGMMQDYWEERRVPSRIDYSRYVSPDDVDIQLRSVSESGAANWEFSEGIPTVAPSTDGDTVFVSTLNYTLYGVDAADGEVIWSGETEGTQRTPPVYYGGNVHVGTDRGTVYSFDGDSGSTVWSSEMEFENAPKLAFSDGTIFVTQAGRDGTVYAYDVSSGEKEWEVNLGVDITSEPTGVGGHVLLASGSRVYSVGDGEAESPQTVRDEFSESPPVEDDEAEDEEEDDEQEEVNETQPDETDDEREIDQEEIEREIAEELEDDGGSMVVPAVVGLLLIIAVGYVYRVRRAD